MINHEPTIHIIDDDPAVRQSLRYLIESVHLKIHCFDSAEEFLDAGEPARPGCLVLDVRMPGMSGLELQQKLLDTHNDIPIIFLTAHADVPMAVRAMHAGAEHFLEKPFNDQDLLDHIHRAVNRDNHQYGHRGETNTVRLRLKSLSQRERQVLECVVDGLPNKAIAHRLILSDRTVESHRASMMRKMKANSIAELVRLMVSSNQMRENPDGFGGKYV